MQYRNLTFTISPHEPLGTALPRIWHPPTVRGVLQRVGSFFGKMQNTQKENVQVQGTLDVQVSHDLTVRIIPSSEHQFLITTTDVAKGYGVSYESVKKNIQNHADELKEGHHFIKGGNIVPHLSKVGTIGHSLPKGLQPNAYYWTKEGQIEDSKLRLSILAKLKGGIAL